MEEKRNAQSDIPRKDESAKKDRASAGIDKEAAGSPRAGTTPTGQSPQRAGTGEPRKADLTGDKDVPVATYQPGQGGEGGGGYQPGRANGRVVRPHGRARLARDRAARVIAPTCREWRDRRNRIGTRTLIRVLAAADPDFRALRRADRWFGPARRPHTSWKGESQ